MNPENVEPKTEVIGKLDEQRAKDLKILILEQQNVELKVNAFRNELVAIQSRVQTLQKAGAEASGKLNEMVAKIAEEHKVTPQELTINPDTGEIFKVAPPTMPPMPAPRVNTPELKAVPPEEAPPEEKAEKKKPAKKG